MLLAPPPLTVYACRFLPTPLVLLQVVSALVSGMKHVEFLPNGYNPCARGMRGRTHKPHAWLHA